MKRIFCAILCIVLLALPVGCAGNGKPQTTAASTDMPTETSTETTAYTEPTTVTVEQQPMIAVSLPVFTEGASVGNDKIFQHVYQNIDLILTEPEVAEKVILDFLNRTDTAAAAERISKEADKAYEKNAENWIPYRYQIAYAPMRMDAAILSLYGSEVSFSGSSGAAASNSAVTYDLMTGEVLKLTQVLTQISRDELYQLIVDDLAAHREENQLYEEYPYTVKDRFSGSLAQENDWFFSQEGLCFFFSPYEIAPYVSGHVVATVPYSKLAGKMEDAYFPPEQEPGIGNLRVRPFSQDAVADFTQFAELILTPGGEKLLLYTDLSVTDVRIEVGGISPYDGQFVTEHTVFATPALTPGDAILLEYDAAKAENLRIRYSSNGTVCYEYLSPDQ